MPPDASPGLQNILGDAGACPEITHKGKAWKLGHPTQRAKAALEELVTSAAVREVTAMKSYLPAGDYRELLAELQGAISAGSYRTWGAGWQRVIGGTDGSVMFLLSLLRERQPEAALADAWALATDCADEIGLGMVRVVPGFFALLVEAYPVPLPPEKKAELVATATEMMLGKFTAVAA